MTFIYGNGVMMHVKIYKDVIGCREYLPSDCLNINEFRAIHINTHSDAHEYSLEQELLPKFYSFGREYQFAIEFARLAYLYLLFFLQNIQIQSRNTNKINKNHFKFSTKEENLNVHNMASLSRPGPLDRV